MIPKRITINYNNHQKPKDSIKMDLSKLTVQELLSLYTATLQELRIRKVTSTSNAPLGEYCERLICNIFGWTRERNSKAGFDATDSNGIRYEIKSRRLSKNKSDRKLSAIRGFEKKHFHYLVGVLLNEDFSLYKAIIVPHQIVEQYAQYRKHSNGWVFQLKDSVWLMPDIKDITDQVRNGLAILDPYTLSQP